MALFMGILISLFPSHREYAPVAALSQDKDEDAGANDEATFFFNARKDISTNTMNYQSMLAADIADRAMSNSRNTHSASVSAVPGFNWVSMGPNNIGGRTRAILIDNTDPTHQTLFAGGVSGGIWKSTNGGATWDNAESAIAYSINDNLSNINVSCIAQDANGAIYIGTGEGFSDYEGGDGYSSAILGGGIFKSTDDGKTWRLLTKTTPSAANNNAINWAYVNRIAIRPDSFQVIYAATNGGLMVSHDSGATWAYAINKANNRALSYVALDVKISNDGNIVVACINDAGYYCYPKTNSNIFGLMTSPGPGKGSFSRIEFAISPTNSNRIYASVITSTNQLDPFQASALSGIYMTTTAVSNGNGGRWINIGSGGSLAFDPYAEPGGGNDQANYDNAIGVPPANEAQVLVGGTTLWEWSGSSITDTVGSWQKVSHYQEYYAGDQHWIHADEHAIVFDQNNPQTVYVGCDGGIFKCTNFYLDPSNVNGNGTGSISSLSFQPINRNYNVTQYYSICFSPLTSTSKVPISINNGTAIDTIIEHMGQGGGTQDNGSPYMNGSYSNLHPNDAVDLSGGDGSGSVVSVLNPNIAYFCSDYGSLLREGNLGTLSFPTTAYTQSRGRNAGGNIDSIYRLGAACFVFPVALYENPYDLLNKDSLQFVNSTDSNYVAGNTIWPISATAGLSYPYVLPKNLAVGDTITVPDRVVSRLAVGFAGSQGGIWINGQAASSNTVIWMPIAGPLSKPDAFTGTALGAGQVHCLSWTPDGNTLFAGTESGAFFRFSNINSIVANSYKSGALWSNTPGGIFDTTNRVVSTSLSGALGVTGRDILSIAVDPANGNNVLVTVGNYNNTKYVYYSSNALDTNGTPTFTSVQGNLPAMPVYSAILDLIDSTGHYITNSAMVATEHGIYTTSNVTLGASTKWVKNNSGMANCLTLAIKQQTAKPWLCNNAGVIYAATHGRGIWSTNNAFNIPTAVKDVTATTQMSSLLVYPSPMTTRGNIEFTLSNADAITITIFDMQGREVKTINMGTQAPGSHIVTFESDDFREGTYFAALTGSNFRKVSKFIVMH